MQVMWHPNDALPKRGAVIAMGSFDGAHLGHQALFSAAKDLAQHEHRIAGALTFDPHPSRVVRPDRAPLLLMTMEERLGAMAQAGLELAIVMRFDAALASLEAMSFARGVLSDTLGIAAVVIGESFRFGRGGQGGPAELRNALGGHDRVVVVPSVRCGEDVVSSTSIREALATGDMTRAAALLGRPYRIVGPVLHGDARGRTIGFPTANLSSTRECLPAHGVYPARAIIDGVVRMGVCNIGVRPTVGGHDRRIEFHIFDFDGDLYDRVIDMELGDRLRGEQRFSGLDELRAQIAIDADAARAWWERR
jgi:riboflavin kinase / FMN adenylyltransferase